MFVITKMHFDKFNDMHRIFSFKTSPLDCYDYHFICYGNGKLLSCFDLSMRAKLGELRCNQLETALDVSLYWHLSVFKGTKKEPWKK